MVAKSRFWKSKLFVPALLKRPAKSVIALGVSVKNAVHFLLLPPGSALARETRAARAEWIISRIDRVKIDTLYLQNSDSQTTNHENHHSPKSKK